MSTPLHTHYTFTHTLSHTPSHKHTHTHTPAYSVLTKLNKEEGFSISPEDPSIAFSPGPSDNPEETMWKKVCYSNLRRPLSFRVRPQCEKDRLETIRQPYLIDHTRQPVTQQVRKIINKLIFYYQKSDFQSSNRDVEHEPTEHTSLIVKEKAQTGSVKLAIMLVYFRACIWFVPVLFLLIYALAVGASVAAGFWLADWSDAEGKVGAGSMNFSGTNASGTNASGYFTCEDESGPKV